MPSFLSLPTSQKEPAALCVPWLSSDPGSEGRKRYLVIVGTQNIIATSFSQEIAMLGVFTPMSQHSGNSGRRIISFRLA